jgi:hypothetical protein
MTDAELRGLLTDCLRLWEVEGKVTVRDHHVAIETPGGAFTVARAAPDMRPIRWFYQTPERRNAARPPRAAPSVVALLSALRNVLEGTGGDWLRVGAG